MPPITSRRPGARATLIGSPDAKYGRPSGSVSLASFPTNASSPKSATSLTCDSSRSVVLDGLRAKLCSLLLRTRVAEKIAAADLRPGEVLDEARLSQRRMKLNMKVEARCGSRGRRLVERHDVWKRRPPEIVEPYEHAPEHL